ncbi:hypothetical protein SCHPADRAFT_1003109 [Schizopora paradoxa]|uniref:MYND-type domain-containing protein n=1 Tax=Schizopora paradoxa TaxID=27342 RepID=A0A0H2R145_9AGAM|nr:hypothetical protein SCHPADRAFT_1003109 [Schizopora paradoxa]
MSSSEFLKLAKRSRTDMTAFMELSSKISDTPTKNLIHYVEACHYHLRKPVKELPLKRGEEAFWVSASLAGIAGITGDMIVAEKDLGQRVTDCWSDIVKWAKVIVVHKPIHGLFKSYCEAMERIFNLILLISESLLESEEVYDLSIDLWKGEELLGVDCHTEMPLLGCITMPIDRKFDRLLERTGYSETQIVKKIVHRLRCAIAANPIEHQNIITSVCLLGNMVDASPHSLSTTVLWSEAPSVMLSSLSRLVNDKEDHSFRKSSISATLGFLNGYIEDGPEHVEELMQHGFLYNVLKSASVDLDKGDEELTSSCIKDLLPSLTYNSTLWSVIEDGFADFYKGGHSLAIQLKKTRANFQSTWKTLESLLVEQLLLYLLFEKGYARERGACADQSCRKGGDRRDFKKCAGCGFALYCSERCQKQNWSHHREYCNAAVKENAGDYNDPTNRFPRKVATAQINRHWPSILALAVRSDVPLSTMGIRVDYSEYPFKIKLFDYRPLAIDGTDNDLTDDNNTSPSNSNPYNIMVAKEALQRVQEGHRCVMLVVAHFDGRELPSIAYLDDSLSSPPVRSPKRGHICVHAIDSHYEDETGNRLLPNKTDVLGIALQAALSFLRRDADAFWKGEEFYTVADWAFDTS